MPRAAPTILDERSMLAGLRYLSARDADLAAILMELGPPPMWPREPSFQTLVHIILEQQVSLASARAALDKLLTAAGDLTPARFLSFDDAALKRFGFSRQKMAYCRHLAEAVMTGRLDIDGLRALSDEGVRTELTKLKGIGIWTANIYLLMALRRPDAWPSGDLGLLVAVQHLKRLNARPTSVELDDISLAWRPWRAVAARLLWHFYLNRT